MAWFVYLIECTDGSIYTGIAVDRCALCHARERKRDPATCARIRRHAIGGNFGADGTGLEWTISETAGEKRQLCLTQAATERAGS
jgi:hypothetical protein